MVSIRPVEVALTSPNTAQLQRSPSPTPRPLQLLIESMMPVSGDYNQETWHLLSIGNIISPTYLPPLPTHTHTHNCPLQFHCLVHYLEWACLVWVYAGRLLGDPVADLGVNSSEDQHWFCPEKSWDILYLSEIYQSNYLHTDPMVAFKNNHNKAIKTLNWSTFFTVRVVAI